MTSRPCAATMRATQALFSAGTVAGLDDAELLRRFTARRDEVAFGALVTRHGPFVLAVCRRALADPHDADDAFQATFLVLARRAGAVRGETLGAWLHGVARRVARRMRADAQRSRTRAAAALRLVTEHVDEDATAAAERAELAALVDEELAGLSERDRAPLILCDLGGLTHEQAAARLGWPVGTVKSRQARARSRLRSRLARRGLAPAAALAFWESTASAAPALRLVRSTVCAVQWYTMRSLAPPVGTVPAVAVAESILKGMIMTKLKLVGAGAVLSVAALVAGVAAHGQQAGGTQVPHAGPSSSQGHSVSPSIVPRPPDRMQALEEKLDRLLRVLERGSPRSDQQMMPALPLTAPPREVAGQAPMLEARDERKPGPQVKEMPIGRSESERLDALERRLSAVEQKLEQLTARSRPAGVSLTNPPQVITTIEENNPGILSPNAPVLNRAGAPLTPPASSSN